MSLDSTYCAICGGPFSTFIDGLGSAEDSDDPDEDVLGAFDEDEIGWLLRARAVGDNPDSPWPGDIWFAERISESAGWIREPNAPENFEIYFDQKDEPWVAPFHDSCREILCRYMNIPVEKLNKLTFFETFRGFAQDVVVGRYLSIDYGNAEIAMGTDFKLPLGQQFLAFDPINVGGIGDFYRDLLGQSKLVEPEAREYNTQGDPFVVLPPEIRLEILLQMDLSVVYETRKASPAFANLKLGAGFWKTRLEMHMPWLWDLTEHSPADTCNVDWKAVYLTLLERTRYDVGNNLRLHGLCNRRRIWEQTCPQLAKAYRQHESRRRSLGYIVPEAHYRRCTHHDVQLMMPPTESVPVQHKSWFLDCCGRSLRKQGLFTVMDYLIDSYAKIPDARLSLQLDWSKEGYLVGIYFLKDGRADTPAERPRYQEVEKSDIIDIPADDWLTGLTFTNRLTNPCPGETDGERQVFGVEVLFGKQQPVELGEAEGDKMFIYPDDDWFVIGLRVQCLADGRLCRIGLLQQPIKKASQYTRIEDTLKMDHPFWARQLLWENELPSTIITSAYSAGTDEIIRRAHGDINPHQILMLGVSDEELSDITSIAVDTKLRGFEVSYGHRDSRSIGPCHDDMKTLEIDGRGGERIIGLHTISGDLDQLCIATNTGRSLRIGGSRPAFFTNIETEISNSVIPYGIAAQWFDDSVKALMIALGPPTIGQEIDRQGLARLWMEPRV